MAKIGICRLCNGRHALTTHHVVPRCMGGDNSPGNLMRVCRPCHDILDHEAGVRPKPTTRPRVKVKNRCACGNSLKKSRVFGSMCLKCYYKFGREVHAERQAPVAWFEKGD